MTDEQLKAADGDIISQVLGGDHDAFGRLIDRYSEEILRIVSRRIPAEDAGEVAHEVFIRAFRSLAGFRGESPFGNWLARIAVRSCHDYWRERYRSKESPMNTLETEQKEWLDRFTSETAKDSFDREESKKTAREILMWALEKIDPDDRAVLELVHLDGFSVSEAALTLGWSKGKVKIRAFRSRNRLRKLLEKVID
ncbi:MAG: RNA polymerase sigma factor [Candidatus Krumholzibacteriota bacterium]|nr:RNA polymerase sigma factor [Candidatus Krumholzibacteriota bacterium]